MMRFNRAAEQKALDNEVSTLRKNVGSSPMKRWGGLSDEASKFILENIFLPPLTMVFSASTLSEDGRAARARHRLLQQRSYRLLNKGSVDSVREFIEKKAPLTSEHIVQMTSFTPEKITQLIDRLDSGQRETAKDILRIRDKGKIALWQEIDYAVAELKIDDTCKKLQADDLLHAARIMFAHKIMSARPLAPSKNSEINNQLT